jgi:hypothetical protein
MAPATDIEVNVKTPITYLIFRAWRHSTHVSGSTRVSCQSVALTPTVATMRRGSLSVKAASSSQRLYAGFA